MHCDTNMKLWTVLTILSYLISTKLILLQQVGIR